MKSILSTSLYLLTALAIGASASAQQQVPVTDPPATIEVPDTASAGDSIQVKLTDTSRAGQTVKITIDNSETGQDNRKVEVAITLGANGQGEVNWDVPSDWDSARFNDPSGTAAEQITLIL